VKSSSKACHKVKHAIYNLDRILGNVCRHAVIDSLKERTNDLMNSILFLLFVITVVVVVVVQGIMVDIAAGTEFLIKLSLHQSGARLDFFGILFTLALNKLLLMRIKVLND
jgi:hypothetical protein